MKHFWSQLMKHFWRCEGKTKMWIVSCKNSINVSSRMFFWWYVGIIGTVLEIADFQKFDFFGKRSFFPRCLRFRFLDPMVDERTYPRAVEMEKQHWINFEDFWSPFLVRPSTSLGFFGAGQLARRCQELKLLTARAGACPVEFTFWQVVGLPAGHWAC